MSLQWCNFLLTFSAVSTCVSCFPRLPHLPIALISNNFILSRLSEVLQKMNIYSYRQTCVLKLRSACESSWESQTKEGCYSEHRHLLNWVSCCLSLEPEPACSGSCFLTVCKPQSTPHPFAYKGGGSCVCSHRQRRNILFLSFRIVVNNVGAGKSWDANLIWSYTKPV